MLVSFIVPLFNGLPYSQAMVATLRATLPAGLAHEIILVDDGSTDGTREWLATLGEPFRVVLNGSNLGYAKANNAGAKLARGEWLALLNNDLVLSPGWLPPLLAAARRLGPRAGAVGNVQRSVRTGAIDHAGIAINFKGKPEHLRRRGWFEFGLREVPAVTGACLLIAKSLWRELGGFDERYVNGCEDVDLCFRAAEQGRINAVALGSVVRHHVSASAGRKRRDEENTFLLVQRWHDRLVALGQRDWCREHFEQFLPEPRDFPDPKLARAIALHRIGLARAPRRAAEGMRASLAIELARWRALFPQRA